MDFTGEIKGIVQDFETGKFNVTFTINEGIPIVNMLQNLFHKKLSLSAKQYREKRSLDANAYCWALMTKIADAVGSSKDEIYEEMLQKYGVLDEDEDGYIAITLKESIDIRRIGGHWKFYKSNGSFNAYLSIKGSSEYNTAEMSHFIDRIIEEAKELDIETATPDELRRMKEQWGVENG